MEGENPLVISLCDRTGIAVEPWLTAGYDAWIVDTRHAAGCHTQPLRGGHGSLTRIGGDVRTLRVPGRHVVGVLAFPPCTHLSAAGATSWRVKGQAALLEALSIADACMRFCIASRPDWWAIENPRGRLSHYWGQPAHTFEPWYYGDAWTKLTCLWTSDSFVMPSVTEPVAPQFSLVARYRDADDRSQTPPGFARALFDANRKLFDSCAPGSSRLCAECQRPVTRRRRAIYCNDRCRKSAHRRRSRQAVAA